MGWGKNALFRLWQLLKWAVIGLICIEISSFLIITITNFIIFGKAREGSRVAYDPYALYLNVKGVRPTHHNAPLDQTSEILWFLGGSTMRGATDNDGQTIPSLLAARLNRDRGTSHLINFGENSFNSLLETKYLQKLLIEQQRPPSRIIFYDGANDCTYFIQYRRPDAHLGLRRLSALIESYHQNFLGLLKPINAAWNASFSRELVEKFQSAAAPLEADSPEVQEFVDECERRYDHVNKVAACFGAQFVLFWQPFWWGETEPVAPAVREQEVMGFILRNERFNSFRQNVNVVNQALAERLGQKPYFIDLRNILTSRTEPVYQADGVHLLDVGRALVAQEMAQILARPRSRP